MITFTDTAKEQIQQIIDGAGEECEGLRVRALKVGNYTFRYQLHLVRSTDTHEDDEKIDAGPFIVFVDPETAELMEGSTIDFLELESGTGFHIDNPAANPEWDDPVAQKVQKVLDERVVPVLGQHGGWAELNRVEGDTAYVLLGGGCQGCASAQATMQEGIEKIIVEEVPEISHVVDATDHAQGADPYRPRG
jgi:Fe/S biogenesis protein NfuA